MFNFKCQSMKKTLLALALFLLSASTYASEKKVLSIFMTDGTSVSFYLSEQPTVKFVGNDVKVVSATEEAIVARTQVERFAFLDKMPTAIEDIEVDDDKSMHDNLEISKEAVSISGLTGNGLVRLFTLKGKQLLTTTPDGEGNANISLESLPAGIYLINYNNTTIKFIKR